MKYKIISHSHLSHYIYVMIAFLSSTYGDNNVESLDIIGVSNVIALLQRE
ncbi:hypothetical protein KFK09_025040 [Dendrobium nobile]|uniref:Uncharacterized protein n=1 Tax=Dendrobium nobile TaxID=94219 RepID=A0A8T3AFS3_DENNO|nr:hypothetical protein KFK09_025040 [Dendrobium nobile]